MTPQGERDVEGVAETRFPVDDARERAIATLRRRRKFVEDAFAYVGINGVLWLIWLIADRSMNGSIPWPAWVSIIWGFLLALDAWRAFGTWPRGVHQEITESEIDDVIRRATDGRRHA